MITHYPKTEAGIYELACRVATIHADSVIARINHLNCPTKQKMDLVDAVIDTAKSKEREQAK